MPLEHFDISTPQRIQLPMNPRPRLAHFLAAIDPAGAFLDVHETIKAVAVESEAAARGVEAIAAWAAAEHLTPSAVGRALAARRDRGALDRLELPPGASTLLAAGYLRAEQILADGVPGPADIQQRLHGLGERYGWIDGETLCELLVTVERRAAVRPQLAAQLDGAAEGLLALTREIDFASALSSHSIGRPIANAVNGRPVSCVLMALVVVVATILAE